MKCFRRKRSADLCWIISIDRVYRISLLQKTWNNETNLLQLFSHFHPCIFTVLGGHRVSHTELQTYGGIRNQWACFWRNPHMHGGEHAKGCYLAGNQTRNLSLWCNKVNYFTTVVLFLSQPLLQSWKYDDREDHVSYNSSLMWVTKALVQKRYQKHGPTTGQRQMLLHLKKSKCYAW